MIPAEESVVMANESKGCLQSQIERLVLSKLVQPVVENFKDLPAQSLLESLYQLIYDHKAPVETEMPSLTYTKLH